MKFKTLVTSCVIVIITIGCNSCSEASSSKTDTIKKGPKMKTYYMGRFAIDVPGDLKLVVQSQKLRYAEISDFRWKNAKNVEREREEMWKAKIDKIKMLPKPVDKSALLLEEKVFHGLGKWAKAVRYRGDYLLPELTAWGVLVDYGDTGVYLVIEGKNNDLMLKNLTNILSHYRIGIQADNIRPFHLQHGSINLPYLEQEETYARFEGHPLLTKLEVTMSETYTSESKGEGLLGRLSAIFATGFASGLDIDKVRTRRRTASGLKGEETILKVKDGNSTRLSFIWRFKGESNSGDSPKIVFDLESDDTSVNEKIRLWDTIIDSFRAAM